MTMYLDKVNDGFRVIGSGGALIAHVTAREHTGSDTKGVAVWSPMKRENYSIRLARGTITVAEAEEMLAVLK